MADTEFQQLAKTDRNPVQETRYQELMKTQGGTGGTDGIDLSQVPSALDYANKLSGTEDTALQGVVAAMRAREDPLAIYNRLETEAGVPQLRQTSSTLSKEIASVEDYLDTIEPGVSGRTRESLVTEAQRNKMVSSEKEPWVEKLTKLGTALGRVQGSLSDAMSGVGTKTQLAMQGQEQNLEPVKMYYSALVDRNARLMTGFTVDRQTKLDVLFDKLNRERQLSDMEWQQANELAQEERVYTKQLQTAAASAGVKLTGSESNDDLLSMIGSTAAETIQWERSYKNRTAGGSGTAGERATFAAVSSLRQDIKSYDTFENLVKRYGDKVPVYQIRQEYDAFHTGQGGEPWGPATENESTVQGWGLKPKAPSGSGLTVNEDGSITIQ